MGDHPRSRLGSGGHLIGRTIELDGERGERLAARVARGRVSGTVSVRQRGKRCDFSARPAKGDAHFIYVADDGVYGRGAPLAGAIQLVGGVERSTRRWGKLDPTNCAEMLGAIKALAIKINLTIEGGGTADPLDSQMLTSALNRYARNCQSQAPGVLV